MSDFNSNSRFISVDVYRSAGRDCSLGGVTSNDTYSLYVPVTDGHITLDDIENDRRPSVILIPGERGGCKNFKPEIDDNSHSMFGGNFVYTSDSRFSRAYGHAPVAVHDRFEG